MSNLSILEQNILHAIEGAAGGDPERTEEATVLFLRWKDRNILAAERAAYEWAEQLSPFLGFAVSAAAAGSAGNTHATLTPLETARDVTAFIKERHVRRYFPNH